MSGEIGGADQAVGEQRGDAPGCRFCGAPLPTPTTPGRPPDFCSVPCRRSSAAAIRRANERLGDLEARASHLRLYGKQSCYAGLRGPAHALLQIEDEILVQRAALLELLRG